MQRCAAVLGLHVQLEGGRVCRHLIGGGAGELLLQVGNLPLAAVKNDLGADGNVVVNLLRRAGRQVHTAVGTVVEIDVAAEGAAPACVMETVAAQEGHPVMDEGAVIRAGQVAVRLLGIDAVHTGGGAALLRHRAGDQLGGQQPLAVFVQPQLLGAQVDLHIAAAIGLVALGTVGSGSGAGLLFRHALINVVSQRGGVHLLTVVSDLGADGAAVGGLELVLVIRAVVPVRHLPGVALNGRLADAHLPFIGHADEGGDGGCTQAFLGGLAALGGVGIGQGHRQIAVGLLEGGLDFLTASGIGRGNLGGAHLDLGCGFQQTDGGSGSGFSRRQVIFGALGTAGGDKLLFGAVVGDADIFRGLVQAVPQQRQKRFAVVSKDGGGRLLAGTQGIEIRAQSRFIQRKPQLSGTDGQFGAVDGQIQRIGSSSLVQSLGSLFNRQAGQVHAAEDHVRAGLGGGNGGLLRGDGGHAGGGLGGGRGGLGCIRSAAGGKADGKSKEHHHSKKTFHCASLSFQN